MFCQTRGYSVLVAMTVSFNDCYEPTRQLAVYSQHEALRSTVSRHKAVQSGMLCPQEPPGSGLGVSELHRRRRPLSPPGVPCAGGGHDPGAAPAGPAQPLAPGRGSGNVGFGSTWQGG